MKLSEPHQRPGGTIQSTRPITHQGRHGDWATRSSTPSRRPLTKPRPRTPRTQSDIRLQVPHEDEDRTLNPRGAGRREARNAPAAAGIIRTRPRVRERIRTSVIEDPAARPARPERPRPAEKHGTTRNNIAARTHNAGTPMAARTQNDTTPPSARSRRARTMRVRRWRHACRTTPRRRRHDRGAHAQRGYADGGTHAERRHAAVGTTAARTHNAGTPMAARMQNDATPPSAGSRHARTTTAAPVRRDSNPHAACTGRACTLRGTSGHRPHEFHAREAVRAATTEPATTVTGHNRIRQPAPPPPTKSHETRQEQVSGNRIQPSNNRVGRPRLEQPATRP